MAETSHELPRFHRALRGYTVSEVDSLLSEIAVRTGSGRSARELAEEARFSLSFRGYEIGEVDTYLQKLAAPSVKDSDAWPSLPASGGSFIKVGRGTLVQDFARSYRVLIDDEPVGKLWACQSRTFEVAPGRHIVRTVASGRSKSDPVEISVAAMTTRTLRTRSHGAKAWLGLFASGLRYFPAVGREDWSRMRPWIILKVVDDE
jgi:DivIVA domain-containing protein